MTIDTYLTPLSGHARKQLKAAIKTPKTKFIETFVVPHIWNDRTYLAIDVRTKVKGRNHGHARSIIINDAKGRTSKLAALSQSTYFTNLMTVDHKWQHKALKTPPSERIVWNDHEFFTFEFDNPDVAFLEEQFGWCRTENNPTDCKIGGLYLKLSNIFTDFVGVCVAWSGNKSLHIHTVFKTDHARTAGITSHVREGLIRTWDKLAAIVEGHLQPGCKSDPKMREPEAYRRLPNGVRTVTLQDKHVLGIPVGTKVPQAVLFEKFRKQESSEASASVFEKTDFVPARKTRDPKSKDVAAAFSDGELVYCEARMADLYPEGTYPEFVKFVPDGETVQARFRNREGDRRATSFMRHDYRTIALQGVHTLDSADIPALPLTLGQMLERWRTEYRLIGDRSRSRIEQEFALAAVDHDSARKAIGRLIFSVSIYPYTLVLAPEGISKTTSLFTGHRRLEIDVNKRVMYAFPDYAAAIEKVETFNRINKNTGYRAILIKSFDRLYDEALALDPTLSKLTLADALKQNAASISQAVMRSQPSVIDYIERQTRAMWQTVQEGETAVFFTVHAVAHNWMRQSPTRLMNAPDYWTVKDHADADAKRIHHKHCMDDTSISFLIHDEAKYEAFVSMHKAEVVEWCHDTFSDWPSTMKERFNAYNKARSKLKPEEFETVLDIMNFKRSEFRRITTPNSHDYGDPEGGSYADEIGVDWMVAERSWMTVADRVMILTTEASVMHVAKEAKNVRWRVYDLDTPQIHKDEVTAILRKEVRSMYALDRCNEWHKENPDDVIISNCAKEAPNTITHDAAKGSNQYAGRNIMQTMLYKSPKEYGQLEALNAYTGRTDMVMTKHVDEFNQSAGRNLGFRKIGDVSHSLLTSHSLYARFSGSAMARLRYKVTYKLNTRSARDKAGRTRKKGK